MRKFFQISAGALLLAAGLGVGLLWQRTHNPSVQPDPAQVSPKEESLPDGGGPHMARSRKGPSGPSLQDDRIAIRGLWLLSNNDGVRPVTLFITESVVKVCDFGSQVYRVDYDVEERGGKRVLVDTNDEVVFLEYRLVGDRLELTDAVESLADAWYPDSLAGSWRRIE